MLRAKSVTVGTTTQSLQDLLGLQETMRGSITLLLQWPAANTADILMGTSPGALPWVLASAGGELTLPPQVNAKDLYFSAASNQTLIILAAWDGN